MNFRWETKLRLCCKKGSGGNEPANTFPFVIFLPQSAAGTPGFGSAAPSDIPGTGAKSVPVPSAPRLLPKNAPALPSPAYEAAATTCGCLPEKIAGPGIFRYRTMHKQSRPASR